MCTHYQCFYHRLPLSNVLCNFAATADLANLLIIYHLLQSMYTIEMVIISPHSIITNPILLKMKHYGQIVTSVT